MPLNTKETVKLKFQFRFGAIKRYMQSLLKEVEHSFNSDLVRLKVDYNQDLLIFEKRFNSDLVRLKDLTVTCL